MPGSVGWPYECKRGSLPTQLNMVMLNLTAECLNGSSFVDLRLEMSPTEQCNAQAIVMWQARIRS